MRPKSVKIVGSELDSQRLKFGAGQNWLQEHMVPLEEAVAKQCLWGQTASREDLHTRHLHAWQSWNGFVESLCDIKQFQPDPSTSLNSQTNISDCVCWGCGWDCVQNADSSRSNWPGWQQWIDANASGCNYVMLNSESQSAPNAQTSCKPCELVYHNVMLAGSVRPRDVKILPCLSSAHSTCM